jgi:hypothetical protein
MAVLGQCNIHETNRNRKSVSSRVIIRIKVMVFKAVDHYRSTAFFLKPLAAAKQPKQLKAEKSQKKDELIHSRVPDFALDCY